VAARAQQPGRSARIAVFAGSTNAIMGPAYRGFIDEVRRAGFVEGRNLNALLRQSDQDLSALLAQAVEMARDNPDALVALGLEDALRAFVQASRTIPIVFVANNYDSIARGCTLCCDGRLSRPANTSVHG
jgi:putative ABC transport system substrate-binding protein